MANERIYYPDTANELTLEWVLRELFRVSGAIGGEEVLQIAPLSSTDSPYTVQDRDKLILADTATAAVTVNLPAGTDGRMIYIKNIATSGANNVTVTPNGSDDIDRLGVSFGLTPMDSIKIIYSEDEANWFVI